MRRTVLSSLALACTAVLASAVPALADGGDATPTPAATQADPTPSEAAESPTVVPSDASEPSEAPAEGGVSAVPEGAPDTGAVPPSNSTGTDGALIGAGAAVLLAGGAGVLVVRRRRATGA